MINITHKKLDKRTLCELINASIDEEVKASGEYAEILALIPMDEEFRECTDIIRDIMKDESKHAADLITAGKVLGCKPSEIKDEDIINNKMK